MSLYISISYPERERKCRQDMEVWVKVGKRLLERQLSAGDARRSLPHIAVFAEIPTDASFGTTPLLFFLFREPADSYHPMLIRQVICATYSMRILSRTLNDAKEVMRAYGDSRPRSLRDM